MKHLAFFAIEAFKGTVMQIRHQVQLLLFTASKTLHISYRSERKSVSVVSGDNYFVNVVVVENVESTTFIDIKLLREENAQKGPTMKKTLLKGCYFHKHKTHFEA